MRRGRLLLHSVRVSRDGEAVTTADRRCQACGWPTAVAADRCTGCGQWLCRVCFTSVMVTCQGAAGGMHSAVLQGGAGGAGGGSLKVRVYTSANVEAIGEAACQLLRHMRRATNPDDVANLRDCEARLIAELRKVGFEP